MAFGIQKYTLMFCYSSMCDFRHEHFYEINTSTGKVMKKVRSMSLGASLDNEQVDAYKIQQLE